MYNRSSIYYLISNLNRDFQEQIPKFNKTNRVIIENMVFNKRSK